MARLARTAISSGTVTRGEFAAACLASPAWELYGLGGLSGQAFPRADLPLQAGHVGYHLRTGLHDITAYDWNRYMDFADGKGWQTRSPIRHGSSVK